MSEPILILEDFTIKSLLGKGHRSEVRLGERGFDQFAIKYIKKTGNKLYDAKSYKGHLNEIKILPTLSHPNIISMVTYGDSCIFNTETFQKEQVLYIVFKHAQRGNLDDFIRKTGSFSEQLARYYFMSILGAVLYLHKSGVAHRDIKPQNILLDKSLNVLLADFDIAGITSTYKGVAGTQGYMAPEIEANIRYSAVKADIFALGVVLFFLVVGRNPFGKAYSGINYNVLCNYPQDFWKRFDPKNQYSDEFKDLIEVMLQRDPEKRASMETVSSHSWMSKEEISELELLIEKMLRMQKLDS